MNDVAECTDEVKMVCLGRFWRSHDAKMFMQFVPEDAMEQDASLFPLNKRTRAYTLGCVYKLKMTPDRHTASFNPSPWEDFVEPLKDKKMVAALRIQDEAAAAAERQYKGSRKVSDAEAVLDALAPLRNIWRNADRINRRLIELSVLDYLRR